MSFSRSGPHNLQGLPTLTEVIEMPAPPRRRSTDVRPSLQEAAPVSDQPAQVGDAGVAAAPAIHEKELVDRLLNDLQRHTGLMIEQRLRDALVPALARLADSLIHDMRQELAASLPEVVASAVSQELARQRRR